MLVLTNSAHRLKYVNYVYEENEDWDKVNDIGDRFGVRFTAGSIPGDSTEITGVHEIVEGVTALELAENNSVPFTMEDGEILARSGFRNTLGLLEVGTGEVLVLGDVGMLGNRRGEPENLGFWRNLARYAGSR